MTDKIIKGSGGFFAPPRPPKPTRTPDTLNSRQFASVQDLLSEGEIEGFATPSKKSINQEPAYGNAAKQDIFLDDTSILRSDVTDYANPQAADFNFQNVELRARFGTANQSHIPGIQQSQTILNGFTSPVLCSKDNGGVTRSLPTGRDAVKVTVTFPQIQEATDKGDLLGSSVELTISLRVDNQTSFTEKIRDTITGRTADAYSKEYRVELPDGYTSADVKIERVTDDRDTGGQIQDSFNVSLIQLLIDDKQTYPNSAYTHLRLDSEQFSSIPKRAFRIRGIKVRIPGAGANNSGTPTVDIQTGRIIYPENYIFNGTMGAAVWCSCPAMILLDLLTTERYGFGTHISDSNLDLYSFVSASRYANELVDDGITDGGKEARFSCNVNLQGSMEAYQLINELAGVMRCFPIWSEGSVHLTQDSPADPSFLFSLANVGEGGFSYSGSSLKQRHSIIAVSYFNMDSREIDYEIVGDDVDGPDALQEDIDRQAKLGIVKKDIKAFACTSRGQARRLGKAVLLSEESETEVVTFTTSIDAGAIVRPGSVIAINDPVKHGQRRSGRIKSVSTNSSQTLNQTATATEITVDNVQDLHTFEGSNKRCFVVLPDGSVESGDVIDDSINPVISINNITRADKTTGNATFTTTPNVNSIWLIESDGDGENAQTFRVISVEEQDGINYAITALLHRPEKYAAIDSMGGVTLPPRNISVLNRPKEPPSNLQVLEQVVVINNLAVNRLILSWKSVTGVSQYLVQYRFNSTNWVSEIVFRPDFEIINADAGSYEFKVFSFNAALKLSTLSSDLTFQALGKTAPPGDVQNLTMEPITNKLVRLRWTESVDADVIHGGKVYVRHSNKQDGSGTFQNSVDLIEALAGNTTDAVVPALEGEYILKFRDDQGNFSLGETSVIVDLPDLIDAQQILSDREDIGDSSAAAFSGSKTNVSVVGDALQLTNPATNLTGTYDFATVLDCEAVFSLNLKRLIQVIGFAEGGQTITATYVRTTATISGQTQTVIEITSNSHGRSVGNYVDFVALTGGATNGVFEIKAVTTNTFQFLATGSAISTSNCTFAFVNTIDQLIPAGSFWDDYAPNGNFDGPQINDTNAAISVSTTNDDPSSNTATFTPFNDFANGTYKARGFKFRVTLESENPAHNLSIQQLGIVADFESRTERSYIPTGSNTPSNAPLDHTSSMANGLDVTFANPFFVGTANLGGLRAFKPALGITIMDAAGGEYFTIKTDSNGDFLNAAGNIVTGTGFNISIKDSNDNPVNKKFNFQAVGYGKGV